MNEPSPLSIADPDADGDAIVVPDEPTVATVETQTPDEVEVNCPGCGLVVLGDSPRPTAAWFCPRCDYPLFWASTPAEEARQPSRAARRRLPGTSGKHVLAAEPCWHCGEMAEMGDTECGRCAATLPKPLAPRVAVPYRVSVPVPVAVRTTVWPYVVAGTLAGAALAMSLTVWLTGA